MNEQEEKTDTTTDVKPEAKCWQQDDCLDYPDKCETCYSSPKINGQKYHGYFPLEYIGILNEVSFYRSVITIAEAMPKILEKLGIETDE